MGNSCCKTKNSENYEFNGRKINIVEKGNLPEKAEFYIIKIQRIFRKYMHSKNMKSGDKIHMRILEIIGKMDDASNNTIVKEKEKKLGKFK